MTVIGDRTLLQKTLSGLGQRAMAARANQKSERETMDEAGGVFKTTRWTTVQRAGQPGAPDAEAALAKLCEDYRPPLFQFARRWLRSHWMLSPEDAEDLTQGFFCHLIEKNLPQKAGKDRGRFRTFLLACFQNYVRSELRHRRRAREIPAEMLTPLEGGTDSDAPFERGAVASAAADAAAEQLLDGIWAESIRQRVIARLEAAYRSRGKAQLFGHLACLLQGRKPDQSYEELATALAMPKTTLHTEVLRLRERFRREFREEVAQTVTNPEQLEEEFRYLLSVLFAEEHA